ncbi:DUF1499 domain-containing protein [Deferribacterales bacterium Es71-Z0220]|uniref:DUF1499 domain-containing protein n=1 Tax=Deferrivibrio essentukiensis TaxID=2880922 RepID=UPI001F6186C2|nr:DUF1499 domain-containing protein [Deferrivibrio essentukiensis]
MKIFFIVLFFAAIVMIAILISMSVMSKNWNAPGLIDKKLTRCPDKPNCVCSEYKDDIKHYIEPIYISENIDSLALLNKILADMGGNIKSEQDNYIAVTFTSSVFNFIDDLEIRIDKENKMIHIRSAARVGYSDFGVNRKRVEQLRHVFDKNADSLKN